MVAVASSDPIGGPFELRIDDFPVVKIANVSRVSQRVLHEPSIQSSALRLFDEDGKELQWEHEYGNQKVDTTVHESMFTTIKSGETLTFSEFQSKALGGSYSAQYGPITFRNLRAGKYLVVAEWRSRVSGYTTDEGAFKKDASIWQGTVISDKVEISIP